MFCPIESAFRNKDLIAIQKFIATKSNLKFVSRFTHETLLHLAAFHDCLELIPELIRLGIAVDVTNPCGQTPLHLAGTIECTNQLLNLGANINALDNTKRSALYRAIEMKREDLAIQLILREANIHEPGLLHVATSHLQIKMVKLLLSLGVDVNGLDSNGNTALYRGNEHIGPKIVKLIKILLQAGANVNAVGEDGKTPLHIYAQWNPNICLILIEAGAKVNAVAKWGLTPLHCADSSKCIKVLLDHGANPLALDQFDRPPGYYTDSTRGKALIQAAVN